MSAELSSREMYHNMTLSTEETCHTFEVEVSIEPDSDKVLRHEVISLGLLVETAVSVAQSSNRQVQGEKHLT